MASDRLEQDDTEGPIPLGGDAPRALNLLTGAVSPGFAPRRLP